EPGKLLPSLAADQLLVGLVGQPGVGDGRLASEPGGRAACYLIEPGIDFGVHPGDEEGGDRPDRGDIPPCGCGLLQAAQVGVHHLAVPGEGEDQRYVDADSLAGHLPDRGEARRCCRDLDEQVVPVHRPAPPAPSFASPPAAVAEIFPKMSSRPSAPRTPGAAPTVAAVSPASRGST